MLVEKGKKFIVPFWPLKNGLLHLVSEHDFKSSKGKCILESLVQSRLERN